MLLIKVVYRRRAINHRGYYSKKNFCPIGCGYYSRAATIQKKNSGQNQADLSDNINIILYKMGKNFDIDILPL